MAIISVINAGWPESLQTFFSVAQLFTFEVDVVSLRCISPDWSFTNDFIVQLCLPFFFCFIWVAWEALYEIRCRWRHYRCGTVPPSTSFLTGVFLDDDMISRCLNIGEVCYVAICLYSMAALRTMNVSGVMVLVKTPVRPAHQSDEIGIILAHKLAFSKTNSGYCSRRCYNLSWVPGACFQRTLSFMAAVPIVAPPPQLALEAAPPWYN